MISSDCCSHLTTLTFVSTLIHSKIVTHIVSMFTAAYIFNWAKLFPATPLQQLPSFDGRLVAYPGVQEVKDYFAWRQVDSEYREP